MADDDGWDAPMTAPVSAKTLRDRSKSQIEAGYKADADAAFKPHFNFQKGKYKQLPRVISSIFQTGYAANSMVGLIGPPGTGKTRFALQEVIIAAKQGYSSLYCFNETVEDKFMPYVETVINEIGNIHDTDMSSVHFWDATKLQLSTADYSAMQSVCQRIWVQNVRYWLERECKGAPAYVVFDSFSNICRRYVPQMPIFHQYLTHGLASLYSEKNVQPVTLMVHQKSLSPRELNTDAVVGGYGINHELDTEINLKLHDVDVWGARNYGWTEGIMMHTLQIPKDRYHMVDFSECVTTIKDGKITLGPSLDHFVQATKAIKTNSYSKVGISTDGGWGDE